MAPAAAAEAEGGEEEEEEEGDDTEEHGNGDDHPLPVHSSFDPPPSLLQELSAEREARKAAEASRYDLQVAFSRLKTFAIEAVRQRDDAVRLRCEVESSKEDLEQRLGEALRWRNESFQQRDEAFQQRNDAIKEREEALRQRNEAFRSLEEAYLHKDIAIHGRDNSRSDIETATKLLVAGADLITTRVSYVKRFPNTLPRSSSYTGLSAIAYGFSKRSEEIVNELLSQYDSAVKENYAFSEQMDRQHNQIALKVSELESTVAVLEGNLLKKTLEVEKFRELIAEKEEKIMEIERFTSQKIVEDGNESLRLTNALRLMEAKVDKVKVSSHELSQLISKIREMIASYAKVFFPVHFHSTAEASTVDEADECIRDSIDRLNEILKLFSKLAATWEEQLELRKKALEDTEGTISRLIVEKKEITNFLESAIAVKQEMLEAFSKLSLDSNYNLNTKTKNRDTRKETISGTESSLNEELKVETSSRIAALEDSLKKSRQEIFELQRLLAVSRGEVEWLRITLERHVKELSVKGDKIKDFEEERRLVEETINSIKRDLAAAEENVLLWKQAARKEAESGSHMLEELDKCQEQTAVLKEQIRQLNYALEDSNSKLRSKEEMATTAIAARSAAERSLQIADNRALELRKKIEVMTRQFELLDGIDDGITSVGWLDACWPYKRQSNRISQTKGNRNGRFGAEMEKLLEPFV